MKNSSAIERAATARSKSDEFFVCNPLLIDHSPYVSTGGCERIPRTGTRGPKSNGAAGENFGFWKVKRSFFKEKINTFGAGETAHARRGAG